MRVRGMRSLFPFRGWVVDDVSLDPLWGVVKVRRDERFGLGPCSCGQQLGENRRKWQVARDLPLGPVALVQIFYEQIQGYCSACGRYTTIRPPGIDLQPKATRRLMVFVSQLCRQLPLKEVAKVVPISPTTAMRWDRKVLQETLPEPNLDDLKILLVDEKKLGNGPFATFVMNGVTGELLHMEQGSKGPALESFLDRLRPDQRNQIVAIGVDRDGAYTEVIRRRLPHVDLVYDKFHVVKNYNDVIDEVRRAEWRKASAEDKRALRGQRYNLLRLRQNRTKEDLASLQEIVKMNENINIVDILKEDLRQLWAYKYRAYAERWLDRWVEWALSTTIQPLKRFARGLMRDREEILNFCKYRITTARLESFNNIVARIVHRACGIQNTDYLFLKLRQESLS